MKEKIPFKKDIIFKSIIGEITDITLTHDYKVKEEMIEGTFYLSGRYKMTEASVIEEDFFYSIPFSIAIGERINKDTINLMLDSFEYKIKRDILNVSMSLNMDYEENEVEIAINEILERDTKIDVEDVNVKTNSKEILSDNETEIKGNINIIEEKNEITNKHTDDILSFTKNNMEDSSYSTYKVINMRHDETIENVMNKYNITIDDIKSLNNLEDINTNNKVIIPIIKNE